MILHYHHHLTSPSSSPYTISAPTACASAAPLSDRQQADILATLTDTLGGSVTIKASVDPDMLGGLVVRVGSRLVDSSLRTKLNQMGIAMRGSG